VLASEWGKLSTPLGGAFGSSGTTGLGSGLAGMSGMGGMGGMGGMSGGGLTAAALGGGGFGGGKGEYDRLWCSFFCLTRALYCQLALVGWLIFRS